MGGLLHQAGQEYHKIRDVKRVHGVSGNIVENPMLIIMQIDCGSLAERRLPG